MKRRQFTFLSSVGVATLVIPTWYCTTRTGESGHLLPFSSQLSAIWSAETISGIGHLYMEKYQDEQDENILITRIMEGISGQGENHEELINQKIQRDYIKENIVVIDGWLLSHTEARQCALYSFKQKS